MNSVKKKVSLQTIADELGVSKYAVSLALNGKPGVSDELREKASEIADRLNYQKIKHIIPRGNMNILVMIPEYIRNDISFYNTIYWAIENEIKDRGATAILTSVSPDMETKLQVPNVFYDMMCEGIITVGVLRVQYMQMLMKLNKPLVSVDQYYDSLNIDSVCVANEEGAFQTVSYLISCGHKDIGFVGAISMTSSIYERWYGYRKAMDANGLRIPEEHCILDASPLSTLLHDQDELENHLSRLKSYPTAWFCAGDMVAITLINVLKKQNIDIPNQISVAAFDDIEPSSIIVPTLTTYNVPRNLMGRTAVDQLIRKIENADQGARKTALYGNLVIRNSVKNVE